MNNHILITERLTLKPITVGDIEKIHELHSLAETDRFNTLGIPSDISETKTLVERWIFENNLEQNKHYFFVVELKDKKEFIGLIGVNLGKEKYKNAAIWFKFHYSYWNRGYATESLKRIITFGFEDLKLHRIEAGCATENIGSAKVLEKAGMLKEAHTRQLLPLQSGWADNYGYAILSTDAY